LAQESRLAPAPFLDLRFDLFPHLSMPIASDVHENAAEPLFDAQRLEQSLLLGGLQLDVACDKVGEPTRIRDCIQHLMHDLFRQSATLAQLGGPFSKLFMERDEAGIVFADRFHLFYRHHDGAEKTLRGRELERGRPLLALEEKLDAAQSALDLPNSRDDAHGIQDVRRRLVGVVALGDGEHQALAFERRLDGAQRTWSPRRYRRGEAWKYDRSPQWENWQCLACCHLISRRKMIELDVL
jgi:hypothetical protein